MWGFEKGEMKRFGFRLGQRGYMLAILTGTFFAALQD